MRFLLFLCYLPILAFRGTAFLSAEPVPEPDRDDPCLGRMRQAVGLIALGVAAFCLLATAAFAQDAAVATSPIASSPMLGFAIDALYSIFGPVVLAFVVGVLARLYGLLGLQQTAENRATVEQVLEMAVRYARMRLGMGGTFAPIPQQHIDQALEIAAQQAFERGPKALSKVGVLSSDSDALKRMLLTRMDGSGSLLVEEGHVAGAL